MRKLLVALSLAAVAALGACTKTRSYNGPEVTEIFVFKETRQMYLMHNDTALEVFDFDLGFAPYGHKQQERDGRTPEGTYYIDRRNPNSAYHLSLGISYPNETDRAVARAAGVSPGGDIFIHGGPTLESDRNKPDWTAGCISVTDKQMEDIYLMVRVGTPIHIFPAATPPILASRPGTPRPLDETAPEVLLAHGRTPVLPVMPGVAATEVLATSNVAAMPQTILGPDS